MTVKGNIVECVTSIPAFAVFYGSYVVKGVIGLGFAYFVYELSQNIEKVDGTVLTAFASVIAAVVAVLVTQHFTRLREVETGLLDAKRREFVIFFDLFIGIMFPDDRGSEQSRKKQNVERIKKIKRSVLIWGSNELIWAWNNFEGKFRNLSEKKFEDTESQMEIIEMMHEILAAFRKELGHGKTTSSDELVGLFVKDKLLGTDKR